MAEKRKRPTKDPALTDLQSSKHARDDKPLDGSIYHPVLSLYYSRVVTLRTFLCEQLPLSSKSRKKKVASLGLEKRNSFDQPPYPSASQEVGTRFKTDEEIQDLAGTLDSTLVGILREHDNTINVSRQKEFASFTQSQALSSLECTDVGATTSQPDVSDFVFSLDKYAHYSVAEFIAVFCAVNHSSRALEIV